MSNRKAPKSPVGWESSGKSFGGNGATRTPTPTPTPAKKGRSQSDVSFYQQCVISMNENCNDIDNINNRGGSGSNKKGGKVRSDSLGSLPEKVVKVQSKEGEYEVHKCHRLVVSR
jgi:hypothetical protein